jgi:hypothetical protein
METDMSGSNRAAAPVVEDVSGTDLPDDVWDDSIDPGSNKAEAPEPEAEDQPDAPEAEADAEQPDAEAPEEEQPEDEQPETEEDQFQPINPPNTWPQQEQAFFRKLPAALQHGYMQRVRHLVTDYTRKTQEIGQVRQRYQGIDRVISQRERGWAVNGVSP